MKVVALFQIYLPYFLPRTPEWSEAPYLQHHFDVEGHLVNIHPRKADEKLFPNPIDEQLAEAKVKVESDFIVPVGAPTEICVRDRCFDRIEAQVYGEVASRDDCKNGDVTFAYRRLAISACNKFLYHCRVAGRDPDVGGLIWHYNFDHDRCYFGFPHSLIWFDAESKEPLRDDEGHVFWAAQSGSIRSPLRMPVELNVLQESLSLNDQPSLPMGLLVSAKEHLIVDQLHEGIVNIASACEIASTQYIERKCMRSDATTNDILKMKKQSFAERRFHRLTLHISGRSLKTDDPDAFSLLEKAYKTRNSVAHSGELAYTDPASGQVITVTRSMANDFFRGCERAVEWVEHL